MEISRKSCPPKNNDHVEEGATKFETEKGLTFGGALKRMKNGRRLTRAAWDDDTLYITLKQPDISREGITVPYFLIDYTDGRAPWAPGIENMLAEDWETVEGEEPQVAERKEAQEETPPANPIYPSLAQLVEQAQPIIEKVHKDSNVPSDVTAAIRSALLEQLA